MYIQLKFWQLWKKYVIRMFKHDREPYLIGKTSLNNTDDIEDALIEIGYQPNYFSYDDKGQTTSMRRIYIVRPNGESIWRQYHVRAFEDGEVRGHDELTYEQDSRSHLNEDSAIEIPADELEKIKNALKIQTGLSKPKQTQADFHASSS